MFWQALLDDFWFYLINLFAFFTAILLTWLYARNRNLQALLQVKNELAHLRLAQGGQLSELEDVYKTKEEHLRFVLQDFLHQLKKEDVEMLRARRNEISNLFILEYRKAFYHFIRLASELYEENPTKHRLVIENHVLPFMQLSGDLQDTLNQANVLALTETPKLQFQYQDFDFVFDFLHRFLRWKDWGLRKAIKQHALRFGFELNNQ